MPWVKDIDLEQRLEKAKHLFQGVRSSLSEEKEKEFYRLSRQVNAVQSQLTRSLSILAHLISQRKRDRRNLLFVAIPLILLFEGARYFEIAREWQSEFALVFALLILFFFELRLQIQISSERVTTKLLLKDWAALGQPESLAQALAAPTEVMEQSRILSLDKNLNVLAHMGLDTKQTCLESIWQAGENDYWDVI